MTVATATTHRVAAVVVTHNSADVLPGLLTSLPAAMGEVPWELVVADNASTDDSVAVVRRLRPEATVVETGRNGGYAAGINRAVAAAGPYTGVLVLNPDVRLEANCVPVLLSAFDRGGVGIAVPRLADARGELIESMRREPTLIGAFAEAVLGVRRAGRVLGLGETVSDARRYEVEQDTDWAEGSVQLISAACWRAVAPWDESFFLYSEETDFGLRARDTGLATRFVPRARATHLEGGSATSPRLWPLLVVNKVRHYRRRHGVVRAVPFWGALLLREGSRAALGRSSSRAAVRALVSPGRLREPAGPDWLRGG